MGVGDFVYNGVAGAGATSSVSGFDMQIGGNTTGTTALVSSGTLTLAGGTNITLSQNGNAITINAAAPGTLSFFSPAWPGTPATSLQLGQSSLYISPLRLPAYLSASRAHIAASIAVTTNAGSSWAGVMSFDLGIYTRSGSTLNLSTSGATFYQFSDLSGGSTASLTGLRFMSVPLNLNLSPGDYWLGFLSQTSSTNSAGFAASNYFVGGQSIQGTFMSATNLSNQIVPGLGHLNSQTAAMPATVHMTNIIGSGLRDPIPPIVWFMNATV